MVNYGEILDKLYPNIEYSLGGIEDDVRYTYENLQGNSIPSKEELDGHCEEFVRQSEEWMLFNEKRDGLLRTTDFYALSDSSSMPAGVKVYRQAIRDIPSTFDFINSNIQEIIWPTI
jgi:hypothetical protein